MAQTNRSSTKHKGEKVRRKPTTANVGSDSARSLSHAVNGFGTWLLKHLDTTYVVGVILVIAGAVVFFAAQSTAWLQGTGGVVVGTGFTVIITTITGRRAIHEQYAKEANLRRKDEHYGPLYAELRNLREILQKTCDEGGPYPQRIAIGNSAFTEDDMTPLGYKVPPLIQWPAFKRGYYWSDFTESARKVLDRLTGLAEAYNRTVSDVRDPTIAVLAAETEQAIQQAKASDEYIAWRKKYPAEASWYEAVNMGKAESSWLHRLDFTPPSDMTLGQAWARSWILSWPVQHEPPTLGYLLAGDVDKSARIIHAGYLSGGDPAPPLEWIEDILKRAISELRVQKTYLQVHSACDQLYKAVGEAEQMLVRALNDIQRRYEGGRPPL